MTESKPAGKTPWVDPDDAPELNDEWFAQAQYREGGEPAPRPRRGRPRKMNPKRAVNIRLSAEVLDHFQSAGPGWQTRIDETLQRVIADEAPPHSG